MKKALILCAALFCLFSLSLPRTTQVDAFPLVPVRDHLTPQEADLVREAQELDKRIAVLIKAAERRLGAATDPLSAKQAKKDDEKWGELKGTRADFLYDLAKILDEAITNVDDVSSRDARNPLVPKAIRKLAEASSRIRSQLTALRAQVNQAPERSSLEHAIENAESIIEAAAKLPPPASKNAKKAEGTRQ